MLSTRKHTGLPHKWPLLADNQDPASVEARFAFHLHRLNLTGKPLLKALNGKARTSTALSQARMTISVAAIAELAAILNTAAEELLRDLTEDEQREWAFYRTSARHHATVWSAIGHLLRDNEMSPTTAARLIRMKRTNLIATLANQRSDVLGRRAVQSILTEIGSGISPEAWLFQLLSRE